jgi:hypothetical protein
VLQYCNIAKRSRHQQLPRLEIHSTILRLKGDHPDGFTHQCKDCAKLLKLTRHTKNKSWLTNQHIAEFHPDPSAATVHRATL